MTKTDSGVEVGKLDERVEVLEFVNMAAVGAAISRPQDMDNGQATGGRMISAPTPPDEEQPPPAWEWQTVRRTWGQVTLTERKSVYSVHGIGAAGVTVILRRQPLTLDNALRWRGQHCLITAIRPLGRLYLSIDAALVELSQCRDTVTDATFPAVMTEEYVQHQQLEPMAVDTHRRVLVTPKAVRLAPGPLVEVDGTPWPVLTPYELDPHKNEYIIGRTVGL